MLEIRLLGRFEVRRDGEMVVIPSRASQSLFGYLLLNPGIKHRREQLAGLLSPDSTEENARSGLRRSLWQLRKSIGPDPTSGRDCFLVDELTVGLDPEAAYTLDVDVLKRPASARSSADELIEAVSVYGGELLPGFYDDWAVTERGHLEAVFENKMHLLLDRLVADGRWTDVLTWGESWIARGGTPEAAYRALMVAHAAQGDSARAAAAYRRCEEALRSELGVEPGKATRELYARLAKGEGLPGLPQVSALPAVSATPESETSPASRKAGPPSDLAPAPGEPPFKGLQYFDTADAGLFFGREALVSQLVDRLRARSLLIVVGASGSGKSSLVRAGLIPALMNGAIEASPGSHGRPASDAWHYHVITPTSHPLQSLALALTSHSESVTAAATLADDLARDPRSLGLFVSRLASAGNGRAATHVFLAIDQFEELFTLCRGEEERAAFIANLMAAAPPDGAAGGARLTAVLTLRADFYAHCAHYPALRAALTVGQEYIGAMSAEELRRAIECPAAEGGWEFEPGLVDELLHDTGGEPGALPLLSHALLETWQRRRGRTMTLGGYAASGRVSGAIARTAQTTYSRLSAEEQAAVRSIFLRLTELGQGTQDTRRRARLGELFADEASRPLVESVLDILADARLITVAENQAEVAHEALIREWPLLREWLAEDREGLLLHRQLTEAAESWEEQEHDPGELYRGGRLTRAVEWSQAHGAALNPLERGFLDASRGAAEAEEREREEHRQRELEAAQKLAAAEGARAEEQQVSARRLRGRARLLAAALVLAIALGAAAIFLAFRAREAAENARQAAALADAQRTVADAQRTLATVGDLASAASANLAADPQLSLLLAIKAVETAQSAGIPVPTSAEEALHRAVQAARLRATIEGEAGVAVSPDGALAATVARNGEISVWPLAGWSPGGKANGTPLQVLRGDPGESAEVHRLAFNGDHELLADAAGESITVWNLEKGARQATIAGTAGGCESLVFSLERDRLAGLDGDDATHVWDARTGHEVVRAGGPDHRIAHIALSPNGGRLAVNYRDGGIEVLDANLGQRKAVIDPQVVRSTTAMQFCGAGRLIVQALDGITLWDAETGKLIQDFPGLAGLPPAGLACSPDGGRVAVGGRSLPLQLWDVATSRRIDTVSPEPGAAEVSFSADGSLLITMRSGPGLGDRAQVWEALPGAEWTSFATGVPARWAAYSSDTGLVAASTRWNGMVNVWQAPPAGAGPPDGGVLLSRTPVLQYRFLRYIDFLAIALNPAGPYLVDPGETGQPRLWHVDATVPSRGTATEGPLVLPPNASTGYAPLGALAFSPDGSRLAGASFASHDAQALAIWDLPEPESGRKPAVHPLPELALPGLASSLAWAPGGDELAVGLYNGQLALIDPESGQTRILLDAHQGGVRGVRFSPDGERLASAGSDGIGKVWSLKRDESGATAAVQPRAELKGHSGQVLAAAFVQNGARVATSSDDGTIRLWDPETGRELMTLAKGSGAIWTLNASGDGSRLAASGADGLRLYTLPLDELLALARARTVRGLNDYERSRFLHETVETGAVAVTLTPVAAPGLTEEGLVRAFVDGWERGDVDGVIDLFGPEMEYGLNITVAEDYPSRSIAGLRVFVAAYGQALGGKYELEGCRPPATGDKTLRCALTYHDACMKQLLSGPLHLDATFSFADGRIQKVEGGPSPREQDARRTQLTKLWNWGQTNAAEDWVRAVNPVLSTESEALEAGAAFMRMCDKYAASQRVTPAP